MPLPATLSEILEWRGVSELVAAELLSDDASGISYDDVFAIAGVAEVSKSTESSSETHYYDNKPAIVIESTGSDTVNITASAIPLEVEAKLTGQVYDSARGALYEGIRQQKYFALGYKTKKTDGSEVYVWRLKGTFAVPDRTSATEDNGTAANGQTLVYTGVDTIHKFSNVKDANNNPMPAKSVIVDVAANLADVSAFFDAVTTPDTLTAKTSYKLTKTQGSNTTLSVKRAGVELANNADIFAGDQLLITVTGGTVTVGGVAFTSGDIHVVTGATAVVSTAAA